MNIENILSDFFIGKKINVKCYKNKDNDNCYAYDNKHFRNKELWIKNNDIECEILKVNCVYDPYEGINVNLYVNTGVENIYRCNTLYGI